jgi:hypothetical protein
MIETLFTVALLELFIGGGGRLIEIGPGTLRMALFVPCALIGLAALIAARRITSGQRLALIMVLAYLTVHLSGLIVGSIRGRDVGDMLTELQQSLYWLAAPFFALVLQTPRMVTRSAKLVQISGVLLALGYLGVLIGSALGYINFVALYGRLADSGEFVGRGENLFVYKGFLYLGIAIVFLVAGRGRYWRTLAVVVAIALALTLTRGFLLATSFAVLLMLLMEGRKSTFVLGLLLVFAAAIVVWEYIPLQSGGTTTESRFEASNNQRIVDTMYVADKLSWRTIIVGEGFGSPINDRPMIENTFLFVFWKLGLAGVVFWLSPIVLCTYYYLRVPRGEPYRLAGAYYFGVVLVYVQTLTNPYLNNPIGLSFVMLALFSLRTLSAPGMVARGRPPAPILPSVSPAASSHEHANLGGGR